MNVPLVAEGLYVEVAEDAATARTRVEAVLGRVGVTGFVAADVVPRGGRTGVEWLAPEGVRLDVAAAWTLAHAVARQLGAGAVVEPMFAGDLAPAVAPGAEESFGGDDGPPPPIDWHLEKIHAREASATLGEGPDVVIAHLDTGYTRHPELIGPPSFVRAELGRNFLETDQAPLDPRTGGIEKQPGHGTATSSVMAARRGTQVARADGVGLVDLEGVAPFVGVAPYRVTESVIILGWQRRLARAIEAAVEAGHPIVSMSLGGLGGARLAAAVEQAERRGVIVVAAAGNYFPRVVAPAKYDSVIACAAIGPDGAVWTHSASGRAVDITAPGHRVWVADWKGADPIARPGSGTSFATACVAGAAALWLRRHASEIDEGNRASLARRFRAAIARSTAGPIGAGYGAGILDCQRLLAAPFADEAPATTVDGALEAFDADGTGAAGLDPQLRRELAFHEEVQGALRGRRASAAFAFGVESLDEMPCSVPLRAALRRSSVTTGTIPASSGAPPPASPAAPPRVAAPTAPGVVSSPDRRETTLRIVVELELRVRTDRP